MPSTGTIQVNAYTSQARIPLPDVAITVTAADGTVIAMRTTDRSGRITPISIPVPDIEESQSPNPPQTPFTQVNLYARKNGFTQIENEDLQVFAQTVTNQDIEMIPLSELPSSWTKKELFTTPMQNL